jgi:acyl-CoA thioester hydrolase
MSDNIYQWESAVRDYELDSQGIVNNATYINYLEQCRNDYARSLNIDFVEYHKAGYIFVVAGIEIQYRKSLTANEKYCVTATISSYDEKRIYFNQEIIKLHDKSVAAKASVHVACLDYRLGKAVMPSILREVLDAELAKA